MTSVGRKPAYKLEIPSFRKIEDRVAIVPLLDFGNVVDDVDDDDDDDVVIIDAGIVVVDLRGNADSMGKTQSMRPLFKIIVPQPGQVGLGPIFTPRNNKHDDDGDDDE